MKFLSTKTQRPRAVSSALAVLGLTVLVTATSAVAGTSGAPDVPAPPAVPDSASQIQNIDQVKTAIKGYYDDTVSGTNYDGSTRHVPSPTGNYAKEVKSIERDSNDYLARRAQTDPNDPNDQPAIVLDVDDTTLNTYSYEIFSNFVYNPTTNAAFVNSAAFPSVYGMTSLVKKAKAEGYTIFFLTGRPESQRAGTTTNLAHVGYPSVPADQLYLKDQTNQPWLSSCSPSCTTIQYKSLTRAHIESLGYHILANFGDQFSDLSGGHADKTVKLPNPMYYLP